MGAEWVDELDFGTETHHVHLYTFLLARINSDPRLSIVLDMDQARIKLNNKPS